MRTQLRFACILLLPHRSVKCGTAFKLESGALPKVTSILADMRRQLEDSSVQAKKCSELANLACENDQTSFIISDSGDVILRYRRLISMFAPTPHDVLDAYLDHYGDDALFPVADTPLGKLACVASEEILYPEITRALALQGAELICHSSSEIGGPRATPKNIAKQARAYENMLYVVSANSVMGPSAGDA